MYGKLYIEMGRRYEIVDFWLEAVGKSLMGRSEMYWENTHIGIYNYETWKVT